MNSARHLIISILISIAIILFGAWGFMLIEGWNFLDALFMTVITLTTVGFGEVHQLSPAGRTYTILLIFVGVGFFGYVGATLIQYMIEGRIRIILGRRRLDRKITRLKNHYIICGYGRIGRVLCMNLRQKPIDLVVIEKSPELIPIMEEDRILYMSGDTADETILLNAGIERARGLIAVLGTDVDNVFLVLTARQLNPKLFIMARAIYKESKSKLLAAGASAVESPYEVGAVSMAHRIIRPTVTSFLDLALTYDRKDIQMEEIPVSPVSPLTNVTLKNSRIRQDYNLIIIAIKRVDGSMMFNPSFETLLEPGSTVIAVGQEMDLLRLEKVLYPI
jgi:voltage-gated potassium channel